MGKQKEDKKPKKPDKRPTITFRVDPSLKDKILSVYGGYQPLEKIIEQHILKGYTPPSNITENNKRIRDLKQLINEYKDIYSFVQKDIQLLQQKENEINNKIYTLQKEIIELKQVDMKIKENIELLEIEQNETLQHSIKTVTQILEENKQKREKVPCSRIPKKVIKLYSDNCNLGLQQFIELLPSDLQNCIENNHNSKKGILNSKGYKD